MSLGCTNIKFITEIEQKFFLQCSASSVAAPGQADRSIDANLGTEVPARISKTDSLGTPPTHVTWLGMGEGEPPPFCRLRGTFFSSSLLQVISSYRLQKNQKGNCSCSTTLATCLTPIIGSSLYNMGCLTPLLSAKTRASNSRTTGNIPLFVT